MYAIHKLVLLVLIEFAADFSLVRVQLRHGVHRPVAVPDVCRRLHGQQLLHRMPVQLPRRELSHAMYAPMHIITPGHPFPGRPLRRQLQAEYMHQHVNLHRVLRRLGRLQLRDPVSGRLRRPQLPDLLFAALHIDAQLTHGTDTCSKHCLGACTGQSKCAACLAGWEGPNCGIKCARGYTGIGCQFRCSLSQRFCTCANPLQSPEAP